MSSSSVRVVASGSERAASPLMRCDLVWRIMIFLRAGTDSAIKLRTPASDNATADRPSPDIFSTRKPS